MSDERRQHPRVPLSVSVIWEGASGKHEARASDISLGGCFVDTIGQVAVGEIIRFKFSITEDEAIELQGEVVSELPRFGFGLRFRDLSDEHRQRLETIISSQ